MKFKSFIKPLLQLLPFLAILLIVFSLVRLTPLHQDENPHFQTIDELYHGQLNAMTFARHAVLPGFHFFMAGLSLALGYLSFSSIRLIQTVVSFLTVLVFYLITRRVDPKRAYLKTWQFFLFPFNFVLYGLIYTDILSTLLVLGSFYSLLLNRFHLAFLVGGLSLLVRQINIFWLGFIVFYLYQAKYLSNSWLGLAAQLRAAPYSKIPSLIKLKPFFKDAWLMFLVVGILGIVILINGSPVPLTSTNRPALISFTFGNIFVALIVIFFLFLPLHLANWSRIVTLLKEKPQIYYLVILTAILYFGLFRFDFFYYFNQPRFVYFPASVLLIKNWLIALVAQNELARLVFFFPLIYSVLSLLTTKLARPEAYLVYPFSVLLLSQHWLIDPRYYILPIAFFILFKHRYSFKTEVSLLVIFTLTSLVLLYGVLTNQFFL